jgi:hypothetical protein
MTVPSRYSWIRRRASRAPAKTAARAPAPLDRRALLDRRGLGPTALDRSGRALLRLPESGGTTEWERAPQAPPGASDQAPWVAARSLPRPLLRLREPRRCRRGGRPCSGRTYNTSQAPARRQHSNRRPRPCWRRRSQPLSRRLPRLARSTLAWRSLRSLAPPPAPTRAATLPSNELEGP